MRISRVLSCSSLCVAALSAASSASANGGVGSTLYANDYLFQGQRIVSDDCYYHMEMQSADGDLVVYAGPGSSTAQAIWASSWCLGKSCGIKRGFDLPAAYPSYAVVQSDGNFVEYEDNAGSVTPLYATSGVYNSVPNEAVALWMQNDGNLVIYPASNQGNASLASFATNTAGDQAGASPRVCPMVSDFTEVSPGAYYANFPIGSEQCSADFMGCGEACAAAGPGSCAAWTWVPPASGIASCNSQGRGTCSLMAQSGTLIPGGAAGTTSGRIVTARRKVVGDLNGDGKADIVLTGFPGWNTLPVAFSNGNGTFTTTNDSGGFFPTSATQGSTPLLGDFNGDGITDVTLLGGKVGSTPWNTIPLALSDANGTFTLLNDSVSSFPSVWAVEPGVQFAAGDFNGDGRTDLALAGGAGWNTIPVALSNGDGTFTVSNNGDALFPTCAAEAGAHLVAGDFNGDGLTDLALTGGAGWNTIPVAFSNGNATFTTENIAAPGAFAVSATQHPMIVTGDFDGDGKADLALAGGPGWQTIAIAFTRGNGTPAGTSFVESNVGAGAFATYADQGAQLVAGDYDGDGLTDLALVGGTIPTGGAWNTIPVARSLGNGAFSVTNLGSSPFTVYAAEESCSGTTCLRPTAVSASSTR